MQSVPLIETSKTRYILYISRWFWSASAGAEGYQAKSTRACEVRAGKNLKVRRACVWWKICRTPTLCFLVLLSNINMYVDPRKILQRQRHCKFKRYLSMTSQKVGKIKVELCAFAKRRHVSKSESQRHITIVFVFNYDQIKPWLKIL